MPACRRLAALLLTGTMVFGGLDAGAQEAKSDQIDVQILSTTDLHMNVMDYDYYADKPDPGVGLVRVASLIRKARAEKPNTLLVDAGDLIQGTPMGDYVARVQGLGPGKFQPIIAALNALGYDAAVMGNHEFNFGLDYAVAAEKEAKYPVLAGNVNRVEDGQPLFPAGVILDRDFTDGAGAKHTVRVGVVGVLTPQIVLWDKDKLEGKVTTSDIVEVAAKTARDLKAQGADVVVAVIHSGLSAAPHQKMAENAGVDVAAIPEVDAVVTGHAHRVFPAADYANLPDADIPHGLIHGKPVVMAGFFGDHLGVIDLILSADPKAHGGKGGWTVAAGHAETRPVLTRVNGKATPLVEADAAVAAIAKDAHQATLDYVRQPVGKSTGRIETYFSFIADQPALDIVSDAQRQYVAKALAGGPYANLPILSAAAPFKAGGQPGADYFTDVAAGQISLRNVADLYLYPNIVAAVKVTGAQVRDWLEMGARVFNRIDPAKKEPQMLVNRAVPSFNFDVIDGVTWRVDVTQPPRFGGDGKLAPGDNHRIVDLRYNGQPVKDEDEFIVVTNNYRANGGGNFPGLGGKNVVYSGTETIQEIIADYLRAAGTLMPATNHSWGFVPITAPVTVLYDTNAKAAALLTQYPNLSDVGPGDPGLELFRVDLSPTALAGQVLGK
ncbi:2',3'-cyclic-nucleotide 2'-phosphodiesterase [Nitrospirillum viridazoti Y2]|uniref:2',3'-cyclic-nucleotide 2'-phosphodiesterase/3'-nucleotidase n=1 Tax=Nitrospirillum amazonense TaxID=28077 RepID=A0A560IYW8_9PROT|nr:bifunctional 2',3'-cyclic-nucleotide 2'-phosphodiesterase/3'-nucleotidase [Nitrospirillum amazonense]EGY00071.1 2',3'-cyclic-nucleotide 2'-phosphodiesterase [Nitrospirillum amazonense Y2]TWB64208.1 2',3'-cyclic-nucleotide 2'-phosphodiesterase/3'-nucleotidase [Nitrospirillum amazonense]